MPNFHEAAISDLFHLRDLPTGTVKWLKATKGFGFIEADQGGQDIRQDEVQSHTVTHRGSPKFDPGGMIRGNLQSIVNATRIGSGRGHELSGLTAAEHNPRRLVLGAQTPYRSLTP